MSAGAGLQQPIPRDWDISLGQPQHPPTLCSECTWAGWSHFSLSWGQDCSHFLGDLTHELSVICTLSQPPAAPRDLRALSRTPGRGGVSSGSQAGCTPGCRAARTAPPLSAKQEQFQKQSPAPLLTPRTPWLCQKPLGRQSHPQGALCWGRGAGESI